jgi:GH25 family lysozyme M1 (1,4-beta-N-acetylmuramidase)
LDFRRKKVKKGIRFLAAVVVGAAAAIALMLAVPKQKAEAATLPVAYLGVDVSSYQGNIDWTQVASSGVTFAMVRIGNTKYGLDTKFAQNVVNATNAGLRVGAYVYTYATTPEEAAADAALAVDTMSGYPITFPVALDIEDKSQKNLPASTQAAIVNTFCEILENAGYTCVVYTNKNWFETKLAPVAWDHWVAQYGSACTYTQPYSMWQYSCTATIPGISGKVDVNYLYGDYFNEIIPNGQVTIDGLTYNYSNWLRTNGFRTENGVTYFYDVNGNKVKDKTVTTDDGTILRMCKDGHVVKSTAEIRSYAATARANLQSAVNALSTAQNALAAAQAAYDSALAAYQPVQAQIDQAAQVATQAAAAYQASPTDANLQAAATAAVAQYQALLQQDVVTNYTTAQTNLTNCQNDVNTRAVAVQAAQAEATAAAEAANIPD